MVFHVLCKKTKRYLFSVLLVKDHQFYLPYIFLVVKLRNQLVSMPVLDFPILNIFFGYWRRRSVVQYHYHTYDTEISCIGGHSTQVLKLELYHRTVVDLKFQ